VVEINSVLFLDHRVLRRHRIIDDPYVKSF